MPWSIQQKIVVPYDFSDHSRIAVDKALEISTDPSNVHVVHVLPNFVPLAPEGFPIDAVDDSVRIEQAMKALDAELKGTKYSTVVREVLIGDAGSACCDRAEELAAELIVLPSHGRTGVSRLLLGSVAERIARLAKCPVLVLKLHTAVAEKAPAEAAQPTNVLATA